MCGNCDYTIHRAHHHFGWDNSLAPVQQIEPGQSVFFECMDFRRASLARPPRSKT